MEYYLHDKLIKTLGSLNTSKMGVKEDLIEEAKVNAKEIMIDLILLCTEACYQNNNQGGLFAVLEILKIRLDDFNTVTTTQVFKDKIDSVLNLFGKAPSYTTYAYELKRNKTSGHSYLNELEEIDSVKKMCLTNQIKNPRQLNVLVYEPNDPLIESISIDVPTINSYGIFINNKKDRDSKDKIKNAIFGIGGNSNITNNAFDVLVANMPSPKTYTPSGFRYDLIPRIEAVTLSNVSKYLRTEGLLCLFMPYTRLDRDFCHYLSRNYNHFQIEFVDNSNLMIELRCQKKSEKVLCVEDYKQLRNIYKTLFNQEDVFEKYTLPNSIESIKCFRGSVITDDMFKSLIEYSSSFKEIEKMSIEVEDLSEHHPLLPFNIGQVGLILASGCLDGVIEEDKEHAHLIKGRVERKLQYKNNNGYEEIFSNHVVQINALTPDGRLVKIN